MRRILILNQNHIGDALFTTPAIAALRAALPDAFIVNAATAPVTPLFAANPRISEHWTRPVRGASAVLRFLRRLRQGGFDTVIAMAASSTQFGVMSVLSGATTRVGFAHPAIRRFLTHVVPVRAAEQHHADDHLDQVRAIADVSGPFRTELFSLPEWDDEWTALRASLGLDPDRPLVGLNPGATVARKQWPVDRWAALADALNADGLQPLLFGGPGDAELVEGIRRASRGGAPSAQGRLRLGGLAAACADCAAFVSGDTGPMHVAVAARVPVVALHGPTDPNRTGPYTDRKVVLHHRKDAMPGGVFGAMEDIAVDDVVPAVRRAMALRR